MAHPVRMSGNPAGDAPATDGRRAGNGEASSSACPFLGGQPFTVVEAIRDGVSEKMLRRLVKTGVVRSLCYGLYVDATVPDSVQLRAAAVAKIVPADAVVCRRSAAWLFGVDAFPPGKDGTNTQLETVRPYSVRGLKLAVVDGHSQTLLADDVIDWHGLRVTSPLATAIHLGRHLKRPFALSALDSMNRAGLVDRGELIAGVDRYPHHPGIRQARELARLVDPAAESPAESWLRLRMIDAGFSGVVPQVEVVAAGRRRWIDLGFPSRPRAEDGLRLGLEYDSAEWHGTRMRQRQDELRVLDLEGVGWRIISVRPWDLWGRDPALELAVGEFLGTEPRLPRRW